MCLTVWYQQLCSPDDDTRRCSPMISAISRIIKNKSRIHSHQGSFVQVAMGCPSWPCKTSTIPELICHSVKLKLTTGSVPHTEVQASWLRICRWHETLVPSAEALGVRKVATDEKPSAFNNQKKRYLPTFNDCHCKAKQTNTA